MISLSKADHEEQIFSFHLEVELMFKKISVNVLTYQFGLVLMLRCRRHGKLVMLLLIAADFALLK